jgi:hypothetical protein
LRVNKNSLTCKITDKRGQIIDDADPEYVKTQIVTKVLHLTMTQANQAPARATRQVDEDGFERLPTQEDEDPQ